MRLIYHPGAQFDLQSAAEFYERRVTGLGLRFLAEFDAAVEELLVEPERWELVAPEI